MLACIPIVTISTKAAIYVRVSSVDQSYENQLPDLELLAERRGLKVMTTYAEKVSPVKTRPEFEKMIVVAHRGRFGVLLIWSLDRLHRSMVGSLQVVLDLDRRGVQVVSVKEPWLDTGGPVRSLLIGIFGWIAEQERLRIGERARAGLERARRRGARLGRPRVEVDAEQLVELRSKGMSIAAIAEMVGVSVGKVHEVVKRVQKTSSKRGSDLSAKEGRSDGEIEVQQTVDC